MPQSRLMLQLYCYAQIALLTSERGITAGPTQSECTQLLRVHGQNRRRRPFASLALAGWLAAGFREVSLARTAKVAARFSSALPLDVECVR